VRALTRGRPEAWPFPGVRPEILHPE